MRVDDLRPLGTFVVDEIRAALASEGLPGDCLGRLDPEVLRVAKTASRSVLGFMNEMALHLDYTVHEAGGLSSSHVDELNRDLRRRRYSRGDYSTPLELVARRIADTQ